MYAYLFSLRRRHESDTRQLLSSARCHLCRPHLSGIQQRKVGRFFYPPRLHHPLGNTRRGGGQPRRRWRRARVQRRTAGEPHHRQQLQLRSPCTCRRTVHGRHQLHHFQQLLAEKLCLFIRQQGKLRRRCLHDSRYRLQPRRGKQPRHQGHEPWRRYLPGECQVL